MKTISPTHRRRFDDSCYHHHCIVNWIAVILLQVLMVSQEKSAVKNEKQVISWFIKIDLKQIYYSYSPTQKIHNGFL